VWPDTTHLPAWGEPDPAERISNAVVAHRAQIARKVAALRRAEAATEAALARYDERWGNGR
jgi:hypothetical protein